MDAKVIAATSLTCAHAGAPPAPACVLVICGAGGDLTHRLLIPALASLADRKLLDERFAVLGFGHGEASDAAFRRDVLAAVGRDGVKTEALDWLRERLFYMHGDFEDASAYLELGNRLAALEKRIGNRNVVFYLATAPRQFGPIVEALGRAGLVHEAPDGFRRVVIEKPFGRDLASAKSLNSLILRILDEKQVYRIDHFLGKETVQNIMALRFGNAIFEPIWNRHHIDHIAITATETVGVEKRGKFYDGIGALRDMVPNHMFQLLGLVAMEAPNSFDADAIRTEKARVIDAIHPLDGAAALRDSVRGQYTAGVVEGRHQRAYRDEPNVDPQSDTETYVALRFMIENWRWAGVPIYIRTGKALAQRRTEIAIQFKPVPLALFRDIGLAPPRRNVLTIQIQPDEGIFLQFEAKVPGPSMVLSRAAMNFRYADYFDTIPSTGYETLIYDCLIGDATLFQRADNIEAGWKAVQPILDAWRETPRALAFYPAGSWGPPEADELLHRDRRHWRHPNEAP
jgi:glucose-6-phosphate 1-dehydrogenase